MIKFECTGCGGNLIQDGQFYICEFCKTKYALGHDDAGQPFTYQPVEKKALEFGKIESKATEIEVKQIVVKEIKLADDIAASVHNESMNIDKAENIKMIPLFLEKGEWDAAQQQINQLLLEDVNCAEAQWYGLMCDKKAHKEVEFVKSLSSITENERLKIDNILSNSSPSFAKFIVNLMFENAYCNDTMCYSLLSTVLPYAYNESVCSKEILDKKCHEALEKTIGKVFQKSFEFLLGVSLAPNQVDEYIRYLTRFAEACKPVDAQKYYSMILDVDPSNMNIHKALFKANIMARSATSKTIADFEEMLKYSQNVDREVENSLSIINSDKTTTAELSSTVWQLLGYHSGSPEKTTSYIKAYADLALKSSLWTEARKYYQLLLSVDSRNPDAYWGLCLVRMEAKTEKELANKKENLIDCQEFKKALSLYQGQGKTEKVNELMALTEKQKNTKQMNKQIIIIISAIVAIILFVLLCKAIKNHRMYSPNNFKFKVEEFTCEEYSLPEITITIKNKSSVDVTAMRGTFKIYAKNKVLYESTMTLSGTLESGDSESYDVQLDTDEKQIEKILDANPKKLKFTFELIDMEYQEKARSSRYYVTEYYSFGKKAKEKKMDVARDAIN